MHIGPLVLDEIGDLAAVGSVRADAGIEAEEVHGRLLGIGYRC
jgi:hypothetical protein